MAGATSLLDGRPIMTPGIVWLTGLSASGKTTLADALCAGLSRIGVDNVVVLDGERVRANLGFVAQHSLHDRKRVLREIVELAGTVFDNHGVGIVATISHKRAMRRYARQRLGRMFEVFLDCPPEVCAARDVKGHYARAFAGEYDCFAGVTEPYERSDPEMTIETARVAEKESSGLLFAAVSAFLDL